MEAFYKVINSFLEGRKTENVFQYNIKGGCKPCQSVSVFNI